MCNLRRIPHGSLRPAILQTAARLYKYSYPDQLLIHAQRPDAVACASYNVWNNTMHRYVRRGSKGIALIDSSGDNVKLHYVFDLSDTGTGRNSRQPFLWQLHEEHEHAVTEAIKERFDVGDAVNFRAFLEETASILVDDYWFAHKSEVLDIIEGSALAGYNEDDLSYFFQQAAVVSTSYLLLTRCGMTPGEGYEKFDFTTVFDFNTPDTVAALGTAVSLISESVLREIETTIRKYERERNAERSQNNERTDLHHERGLSPAQPDLASAAHDASEQVRQDAQSLPEGAQAGAVEHDAAERDAGQPSSGDQRSGEPAAEPDDAGDSGSAGHDGGAEGQRPDELDAADERPEGTGRGSDPHGAGLQLSFLDVSFSSEAEQIQTIQQAESALFAPFAFSVPQDTVDQILRLGSNAAEHRKLLMTEYSKGKTIENISAILRTTYHGGNGFETAQGPISVWYAEEGIRIARGTSARYVRTAQVISWEDAAKRIGEMLEAGQFATSLEIASAPGRERYQLAETLSYIVRDLSEQARNEGYMTTLTELNRDVYPDCTIHIAEALAKPDMLQIIADEYKAFLAAYQDNHSLMRFRYHRLYEAGERLEEMFTQRRDYVSSLEEVTELNRFITEDEINEVLVRGNQYSGWKEKTQQFFLEPHTPQEKISFLKDGYGIGGHSPAVSGEWHSDEWHDGKGIRLKKDKCETLQLGWPNVAKRIMELIQQDRYLTAEEKAALEEKQEVQRMADEPLQEHAEEALETQSDRTDDYRLLSRLRSDCDYFLGAGGRSEKHLWAGNVYEQIAKMRELYQSLPQKPEWLTEEAIDQYAAQMAPPYLVMVYHHFENGFDAKLDYQTLEEAEKAAQGYVNGTMEADGFQYDGAAVYDQQNMVYLRSYGDYPDEKAQAQLAALEQPKMVEAEADPAYRVGDTVYLDGRPFDITEISEKYVQLFDKTVPYPLFRSERKGTFARLLALDQRNQALLPQNDADDIPSQFSYETEAVYTADKSGLPFDVVVESIHVNETVREQTEPTLEPQNFRITDDDLGAGGKKTKYEYNAAAIYTLKQIEAEGRQVTPEEQEILSRYVGWGGIPEAFDEHNAAWANEYTELKSLLTEEEYASAMGSVLNAHYTSPTVIRAIYDAVEQMGFTSGNILEPSMGIGNFFGMLPESMQDSRLYGVELDSLTGRIAQQLYPKANITVAGFETTDRRDFYDLAIGNVPFGQYQVNDRAYNKLGFSIHNYFFAKALDQVRPGGVVAFVTSRYTLDQQSPEVRKYLAERADLLGAIRLPNNAFRANAGTDVVSDIIFLQKRESPLVTEPDWVHLGENKDGFAINQYFIDHPEMVLGEESSESTRYGRQDFTVIPREGVPLAEQLRDAVQHIHGEYVPAALPELGEGEKINDTLPADPNVKNYSYTVVDGQVYYRENSIMVRPSLNQTAQERVKGLVALRDCVHALIDAQLDEAEDGTIYELQKQLNEQYDAFTAKYGLINSRGNALAFSDDSSYYLLCSLEVLDDQQQLKRKADMFTKRTIKQQRSITHVDTAAEALAVSIGEKAGVDLPFMAQLTGKSENEIAADLTGVIFPLPETGTEERPLRYVTADEYLSGNVRQKLRTARLIAEQDERFLPNVRALEAAQPQDLDASEIEVRLGATWVDKKYIQDFMYEVLKTPYAYRREIQVHFSPYTAEWNISGKGKIPFTNVAAYTTYGTTRANAYHILEDTLNLRDVRIFDIVRDADGKESRVLNQKETTLAQQKQQSIKDAFRDWIWQDADRRHALVEAYNERFNSVRLREYDGSHITFAGMNPEITLREHQSNAVAHILYGGNTLLAHEVGAGKTFEMIAAAMESKRLGLCQKPMFVVPNHLTEQWASEFLRLYPSANILVTSRKEFEKNNRKKFCSKVATGDYDAVIIGHSQFERIPVSLERQERFVDAQIDEIMLGIEELKRNNGEQFSIKQLVRTQKQLEARLKKLQAEERKDDVITFEQLGVDRLYVDEAHFYKNLFLITKMRNVAGLSTSEAQKSSDMYLKCQYMDELTGGRGIVFATGTPVSNSMTELYTMQRYLQYAALRRNNLTHFDAWASTFGETATAIELAPEGTGYRARTRFSKFFNLPELMTMFKEVADIKTADQLHLPTPKANYETVVVKPSEIQQQMVQALSERAARVHAKQVDPTEDNMLKITSDGRKLGLDQRLINPLLPDDPGSKVNICIDNIFRIWNEGQEKRLTQLVFCDMSTPKGKTVNPDEPTEFSVYDDVRAKLIERGVPANEIAFIHNADTEAKKKKLFAKVRSGHVRVLIGSTAKMGAGTNCQDRLIALHDLDCPWRPGDLEQRAGRIVRQGNTNPEVFIYRYVTEGTFDGYLWQTIENKQKFISQIMTSKSPVRSCDDVDETVLSYAEIKALCAGDPRIREKMDLDVDVARLRLMKADHQSKRYRLEDQLLKFFPQQIETTKGNIAGFEKDVQTVADHPLPKEDFVGMEIMGRMYTEKEKAGEALLNACKEAGKSGEAEIGHYRGFGMKVQFNLFTNDFQLILRGAMSHPVELSDKILGNLTRIENVLNGIPKRIQSEREQLENIHQQMEAAKEELDKPFPQEEELQTKSARLAELDAALNMDEKKPTEHEQEEERPSVRDALKKPCIHGSNSMKNTQEQER